MEALRAAAPLARWLLALGERQADGWLSLVQRGRRVRIAVARGEVCSLAGVDTWPLGDALLALGAIGPDAQGLLAQARGPLPVGARLIVAGATSSSAVRRALALQRMQAIESMLRWPCSELSFQRAETPSATRATPVDLTSMVWSALFALAAELPAHSALRLAGERPLALNASGARKVRALLHAAQGGALEDARALRAAYERSAALVVTDALIRDALSTAKSAEAQSLRAVFRVLGVAHERPEPEDAYALLLRKTRELARNESARVLLDVAPNESAPNVRRAFRRLAQKLHPDRFQAGDARLFALSQQVMGALTRAEHTLRA